MLVELIFGSQSSCTSPAEWAGGICDNGGNGETFLRDHGKASMGSARGYRTEHPPHPPSC